MKFIITVLLFLSCFTFASIAQKNNGRQLYEAIHAKDTLQVEMLLNKGADANYKEKWMKFEMSMLILAVQNKDFKSVKLLIEHKAQIDWKDIAQITALMYAAYIGDVNIINYLIKSGADIHAHDDQGNTVLSAAKEGKHPEAIQVIEAALK